MLRSSAASVVLALGLSGAATVALAPAPAQGPAAELGAARIRIQVESPATALVTAELEFVGDGEVRVMVAWFPGQSIEGLALEGDGPQRWLRLPAGQGMQRLQYRVRQQDALFRVPLPVPRVPPVRDGLPVSIELSLPAGATPRAGSLPRLASPAGSGAPSWTAQLPGVPAFTFVRWGDGAEGAPGAYPVGGFGGTFWGFFVFTLLWCGGYFAWAAARNRRELER